MDLYHLTTLWRKRFPQSSSFDLRDLLKRLRTHGGFEDYINKHKPKVPHDKYSDYVTDYLSMELNIYIKNNILIEDIKEVIITAEKLAKYINDKEIYNKLSETNSPGTSSKKIQDIIINYCKELGFESEKQGLFKDYNLRPDYYKKINNDGILLEVERGKTITNNMDFYDLWKCHICKEANHLFLMIPEEVSHTKNIYKNSCRRLDSFFEEENYINIDSLIVFGY